MHCFGILRCILANPLTRRWRTSSFALLPTWKAKNRSLSSSCTGQYQRRFAMGKIGGSVHKPYTTFSSIGAQFDVLRRRPTRSATAVSLNRNHQISGLTQKQILKTSFCPVGKIPKPALVRFPFPTAWPKNNLTSTYFPFERNTTRCVQNNRILRLRTYVRTVFLAITLRTIFLVGGWKTHVKKKHMMQFNPIQFNPTKFNGNPMQFNPIQSSSIQFNST